MSSSSTRDTGCSHRVPMIAPSRRRRSPGRNENNRYETTARGQTTPVVALVALFAVCAGISLYATVLVDVTPSGTGNAFAEPTLERVYDAASEGGVVSPAALSRTERVAPDGYRLAVAVTTERGRWTNGNRPPSGVEGVDTAARPAAVSTADGEVIWGRLQVWVWR